MRWPIVVFILAACGSDPSGDAVRCTGANPVFPTFDKACTVASDCFVALHTTSCCGTEVAIGVSTSDRTRFEDDEARCDAQYPGCGCAAGPTQAEDGKSAINPTTIIVRCDTGRCMTAVQ